MHEMKKLAIVTTHPIQYNAPLFELLAKRGKIGIKVFYTWGKELLENKFDPGFERKIEWDIPLLAGYEYEFLENTASDKGSHHYRGIDNPGIIDAIERYDADAVLVYGWSFKSHLRTMRYFHGKLPVLFRGDSTLLDDKPGSPRTLARRLFLRNIYRNIDFALYVGTNNREYFSKIGLKDDQLVYAPHAVDNAKFACLEECHLQAARFREELGIPADGFVFLFAGKFETKKDPLLLLDTFIKARLHERAFLVLVGNGQLERKLKARADGFATVRFMDFQNQSRMPAIYRLGDVFILPSRGPGETWGLAMNESMCGGKVVIASDKCGGAIDLIRSGENGYIFKAKDGESLAAALLKVYAEKTRLPMMGQRSRELIGNFSLEQTALAIEQTLFAAHTKKAALKDEDTGNRLR